MGTVDRYTCVEVFSRLNDYLDRELSEEEMALVREHLAVCAVCASEFAFEERLLVQIRGTLPRIAAPPDLVQNVLRALSGAAGEGDPPADPPSSGEAS